MDIVEGNIAIDTSNALDVDVSYALRQNNSGIIGRFPPEIWCLIFYCIEYDNSSELEDASIIVLRCRTIISVCHDWRAIAFDLPNLWNEVNYTHRTSPRPTDLSYVEACLVHSKTSVLTIHVYYSDLDTEKLRRFVHLLVPHAHRLRHVNVCFALELMAADFFPLPGQLPLLYSLSIEIDYDNVGLLPSPPIVYLSNGQAARLRSLTLLCVNSPFQFDSVEFKDLTVLHLEQSINDSTLPLLSKLPPLEKLRLGGGSGSMDLRESIVLNTLSEMIIDFPIPYDLLLHLRTPRLRAIKFTIWDEDSLMSLISALERIPSPPHLRSFNISFLRQRNVSRNAVTDLVRFLKRKYSITNLKVSMNVLPKDLVFLLQVLLAGFSQLKRLTLHIARPAFFGKRLARISEALDLTLTTCPRLKIKYVSSGLSPSISPSEFVSVAALMRNFDVAEVRLRIVQAVPLDADTPVEVINCCRKRIQYIKSNKRDFPTPW